MKKIVKKLNFYKAKSDTIINEFLTLPEGSLVKRGKFYYQVINQKQIGITKNEELKRKLSRKKYLLFRKEELSKNIVILEKALDKIHEKTDEEVINSFSGAYSEMPVDYFYHPSMKRWLEESRKENTYRIDELVCTSNKGTKLRSKSELIVANMLEAYGLFYLYEPKLKFKNGMIIYPDFIIIDLYTGKIIIWEHFGALHQDGYGEKMVKKMDEYLKLGYIPFETIIYTFEPDVLKPDRLKHLIETIILD